MKEIQKKKLVLPIAILAVVGIVGSIYTITNSGSHTARAQDSVQTQISESNDVETNDDQNDTSYTSSIQVGESQNEANDATESRQLQSLVKISEDEAKTAAEDYTGGTATSVTLEEDGGNVVYSVTIGGKDVKVDAGNGTVLQSENSDLEANDQ